MFYARRFSLEAAFTKETGIPVRHAGAGTGVALEMARRGGFDLLLVHAKNLEEKSVAEGYGTRRIPFIYNDFVIVGPAADPAGLKGMTSATAALMKLAAKGGRFLTRGDKSGTHAAELELWDKAGLKPQGAWYQVFEKGSEGNVATLVAATEQGAYTVIERASHPGVQERIQLQILVEGDEVLLNRISLIPVNPARFPCTDTAAAQAFVAWLIHWDKGQKVIAAFGKECSATRLLLATLRVSTPTLLTHLIPERPCPQETPMALGPSGRSVPGVWPRGFSSPCWSCWAVWD